MLRLALDATPLLGPRTGVGAFCTEVLARLAQRDDLEITAFAVTWRGRHSLGDVAPPGVRVVTRPLAARPARMLWRRSDLPPVEWWTGPVDVVHGPNAVVPPTRAAARVLTVHDLTAVHHPEMCTPDVLHYPEHIRRAVRGGAWVHTVSRFVGDEVIEVLGVPADRVVVIPNGPTEVADADPIVGRALAGADRYLLFLGTIEPRKDLPLLVRAFDEVTERDPDLRLVLAGPDGWGVAELERALVDAHHADRVVRLGWVGDDARAALLRGAAALVYPSRYEGFGLPVLEANACGLPVVATSAGSIPEVAGGSAALVPPADAAALAAALHRVLDDDRYATELAARGLANVGRYSWDATTDALADLYRELADERPRRAP